jgi:hypothetical protein
MKAQGFTLDLSMGSCSRDVHNLIHEFLECITDFLNGSASIKAWTSKLIHPHQVTNTDMHVSAMGNIFGKTGPIRESCSMSDAHSQ